MNDQINCIDLFAGAGGLSEGFMRAGFKVLAHVEQDRACCFTLKTRLAYCYLRETGNIEPYVSYLKGEIDRNELYAQIPTTILEQVIEMPIGNAYNDKIFRRIDSIKGANNIDLIIGGPPCQAYSLVGRARAADGMKGDPRNFLFLDYAKYIHKYKPRMFVFENVPGLHSAGNGSYYRKMLQTFKGTLRYRVKELIIDAQSCGVLQNRKRVILIGYKDDVDMSNHSLCEQAIDCTVSAVFADLPAIQAGQGIEKYTGYVGVGTPYLFESEIRGDIPIVTQHICRNQSLHDKKIYRAAIKKWDKHSERLNYNELPEELKTHENRNTFLDRFKVVAGNLPAAQTIAAHIAKDGNYYIHPDIKQCRSLTIREAARIQSFPDDYYFEGEREGANRTSAFKQIGNAVPPLMAYEIAKSILNVLCPDK